jgi:hypothetical protein
MLATLAWPGLAVLYLLLPGHPLTLLRGVPLGDAVSGLALLVGLAAWCGYRPRGLWALRASSLLLLALALKLSLAAISLPRGTTAAYISGVDPSLPAERSTEWRIHGATRVDYGLELSADQFGLHFVNDMRRFNFFTPGQPRRDLLPFSATWQGWIAPRAQGTRCLHLEANGTAALQLGDAPPATIVRAAHVESRVVCADAQPGANPIDVRYSRPQGGVPYLKVSETAPGGQSQPLTIERLLRAPASAEAVERDFWLGSAARGLDLLVIVGLLAFTAAGGRRPSVWERPLLALSILGAFTEGLAAHRHFEGRTPILSGGNDWLAYESYARDVLLSGPLMTGGRALGQGEPFYYQPLYGYFLALLHLVLGESVYGILVGQHVLVALAGVLTYFLAKELFGARAAAAAFALFWVFRYLIFNQVAGLLLSENLVDILIPPMLLLLARWHRAQAPSGGGGRPSWQLAAASVLLGLAILTRSTPLLFLPPAALLIVLRRLDVMRSSSSIGESHRSGRWRAALAPAGLLVLIALALFSLAGFRNLIVAGKPVLLPESASTNIYETHRPGPSVDLSRIDRDPIYEKLGLDRRTREVLQFIRQDPLGYTATLVPMGLYAIGFTGPALGTNRVQYELVLLTALYVAGLLFVPAVRQGPIWYLHAFVLTHFFQMMVFMSHQYGFRLPLPMYGPMAVIAGQTLASLSGARSQQSAVRSQRPGASDIGRLAFSRYALYAAVLMGALWTGWEVVRPRAVEAEVFGLGGDAGSAARAVAKTSEAWLADRVYFSGQDGRSPATAYMPGLAYREMKWLDTSSALVWPADGSRGLLVRPPGASDTLMLECWDSAALEASVLSTRGGTDRLVQWLPPAEQRRCARGDDRQASFGSFLDLLRAWPAGGHDSGRTDLLVAWRVIQPPAFRTQLVAERLDPDGAVLDTVYADPYPSGSWEPGELIVARIGIPSVNMPPGASKLAVGFTRGRPPNRLAIEDPLTLFGQIRVMSDG